MSRQDGCTMHALPWHIRTKQLALALTNRPCETHVATSRSGTCMSVTNHANSLRMCKIMHEVPSSVYRATFWGALAWHRPHARPHPLGRPVPPSLAPHTHTHTHSTARPCTHIHTGSIPYACIASTLKWRSGHATPHAHTHTHTR